LVVGALELGAVVAAVGVDGMVVRFFNSDISFASSDSF
jgi:hypothetical protein